MLGKTIEYKNSFFGEWLSIINEVKIAIFSLPKPQNQEKIIKIKEK